MADECEYIQGRAATVKNGQAYRGLPFTGTLHSQLPAAPEEDS